MPYYDRVTECLPMLTTAEQLPRKAFPTVQVVTKIGTFTMQFIAPTASRGRMEVARVWCDVVRWRGREYAYSSTVALGKRFTDENGHDYANPRPYLVQTSDLPWYSGPSPVPTLTKEINVMMEVGGVLYEAYADNTAAQEEAKRVVTFNRAQEAGENLLRARKLVDTLKTEYEEAWSKVS